MSTKTALYKFDYSHSRIPKIEEFELNRRLKLITPCFIQNKKSTDETIERPCLVEVKDADPKNSFIWDIKKGKTIGMLSHSEVTVRDRPAEGGGWYLKTVCETVGEFITLHSCGYPTLFKPSIEEVLSQLPDELFDEEKLAGRKLYFTTNMLNETDFLKTSMISSFYHIAKTFVYIDSEPKD